MMTWDNAVQDKALLEHESLKSELYDSGIIAAPVAEAGQNVAKKLHELGGTYRNLKDVVVSIPKPHPSPQQSMHNVTDSVYDPGVDEATSYHEWDAKSDTGRYTPPTGTNVRTYHCTDCTQPLGNANTVKSFATSTKHLDVSLESVHL